MSRYEKLDLTTLCCHLLRQQGLLSLRSFNRQRLDLPRSPGASQGAKALWE